MSRLLRPFRFASPLFAAALAVAVAGCGASEDNEVIIGEDVTEVDADRMADERRAAETQGRQEGMGGQGARRR